MIDRLINEDLHIQLILTELILISKRNLRVRLDEYEVLTESNSKEETKQCLSDLG